MSAHMRGILLPLRAKVPLCGGVPAMPAGWSLLPTPRRALHATPRQNHPRKLCLRGARWAVGIVVRRFVFYSIAQACSNTYEPVLSLYVVFAGAYIIHEPPGLDARQLVAVPIDVWPDGHASSAMVM